MKRCGVCGAQLQDQARRCPLCGAEQAVKEKPVQVGSELPPPPVRQSAKQEEPSAQPYTGEQPYTGGQGTWNAAQGNAAQPYGQPQPYMPPVQPYVQPSQPSQTYAPPSQTYTPPSQTYTPPAQQRQAPSKPANGAGIAGFVFSLIAFVLIFVEDIGAYTALFFIGLTALICSSVGVGRYGARTVSGFAVAGLIVSLAAIGYWFGQVQPLLEVIGLFS